MRYLQADDKQQSHDKKAQHLRKMFKNPQKSVDSITDICLHVGMDARKLKKEILYDALRYYLQTHYEFGSDYKRTRRVSMAMDIDQDKVTEAKLARFDKFLREMIKNAESKI